MINEKTAPTVITTLWRILEFLLRPFGTKATTSEREAMESPVATSERTAEEIDLHPEDCIIL